MKILGNIQTLRALAAWSVVFYHYAHDYYQLKPASVLLKFVGFYGNFGVDLFFVISGLIMQYSVDSRPQTAGEFLNRRFIRIIPAYWFYTFFLLCLVCSPIGFFRLDVAWTWRSVLESLLFLPDNQPPGAGSAPFLYVGWTLTYEMVFYLLFATCLLLPRRTTFPVALGLLLILPLIWPEDWPGVAIFGNYKMCEFATGMMVGKMLQKLQPNQRRRILISTVGCIMGLVCLVGSGQFYQVGRVMAATFFVMAAVYDETLVHFKISRITQKLGDISYSTYLVHPIVIMLFVKHTGLYFSRSQEWFILTGICISVYCISILSYRYVENGIPKRLVEWTILQLKKKPGSIGPG